VAEFDAFATRMTAPLAGLAQLLTGDREAAATLVHTALTRAYTERRPNDRRVTAALVRTWLAGAPPVGEPAELHYDLELLRRSLDALPEKQRVAVALHHWSGLPVADIAAMLRRPERAVAADLAAGVAELPAAPESTVDARLAALVAAAGPPLVDLTLVAEAGRRQRRYRRRTAVAAAGALITAGTVAALLTGGDPEPPERPPVRVVDQFEEPAAVVDGRARRLTAQLNIALDGLLPRGGPVPEFAVNSADGPSHTYVANVGFGRTMLIFIVESRAADAFVPCSEPDEDCRYRQFPDETVAEVVVKAEVDRIALSLTSRRPDSTAFRVLAYGIGAPELTVEDMFGLATAVTY